jgi:hypothetical protein
MVVGIALRSKYATLAAMGVKMRDALQRRHFAPHGSCICSWESVAKSRNVPHFMLAMHSQGATFAEMAS